MNADEWWKFLCLPLLLFVASHLSSRFWPNPPWLHRVCCGNFVIPAPPRTTAALQLAQAEPRPRPPLRLAGS